MRDLDKPTAAQILQAMHKAINDGSTHNYPPHQGIVEVREANVKSMVRRFGVTNLDPRLEVIYAIGSKELIHNTCLAFVESGYYILIPQMPSYLLYF